MNNETTNQNQNQNQNQNPTNRMSKLYVVKLITTGNSFTFTLSTNGKVKDLMNRVRVLSIEKFNLHNYKLIEAGKQNNENEEPIDFTLINRNEYISNAFNNCCFYLKPIEE